MKYELLSTIDEGSCARVYAARARGTSNVEDLAIKVIQLTYSLDFVYNEVSVLKNMDGHEGMLRCKDVYLKWDRDEKTVWIVTERCAGDVVQLVGKLSDSEVAKMAKELLIALEHLHRQNVIHRDIKLSNILFGPATKLADFGICSLEAYAQGTVGTAPYMAPEVAISDEKQNTYDAKVDIWSLGVCVLELVTGAAAWGGLEDDEIMELLKRQKQPKLLSMLDESPRPVSKVILDFCHKCFIINPTERWSATQLLNHPLLKGAGDV